MELQSAEFLCLHSITFKMIWNNQAHNHHYFSKEAALK